MTQAQALEIMQDVADRLGLPMLETLMHIQDNPDEMSEREMHAFRVAMAGFRQLLLPA